MAAWDADDPDDGSTPPWATCRPGSHPPVVTPDPARLLLPLSQAEDLLSRLDARAGTASGTVREGLVARLALAWLTQAGLPTHPHDLGLRAAGLTGSWSAASDLHRLEQAMPATWGGSDGEVGAVAAEHPVEQALALARLLTRLPVFRGDPLDEAERLAAALRSLGDSAWPAAIASPGAAIPDFATWRRGWLRTGEGVPALLAAAQAAARWLREAGEGDLARPEPQQAIFLAAVLLKRRRRLAQVPLVFWSGAGPGERLPRPTGDPAAWPLLFLARVAAAARKGLEVLDRLEVAQQQLAALAEGVRRSSSLPAAAELLLRRPLVTAPQLAKELGLTHQGTLLILARLQEARIIQEVTGRGSFRAHAVWR
ncbi:helix-turn-helix domain-containing protein [Roseomonas gilardii]|uniref:Helix-turn-helix domain-containing protein n=1 Tax=Roseomonas gilardii TaxID=257708 RepID=A0ABU3MKA4_9PROT|nr:helix-turn-helix domain-containing protein [Roseomonas gilardii]MDT8332891.1 helix-turn-helix domain-containing protein [Roseomonas gilardii]